MTSFFENETTVVACDIVSKNINLFDVLFGPSQVSLTNKVTALLSNFEYMYTNGSVSTKQ